MSLRVLQFGATGQLARELARQAGEHDLALSVLSRAQADLADPAACAAAIAAARIARLYYGASDPKSGGVAHGARVFSHPQAHHAPEIYDGIGASETERLLKAFFGARRA